MYLWTGDIDVSDYVGTLEETVLIQGAAPDGSVRSATWRMRMRVHVNAENAARSYITVTNGNGVYLSSETVDAESYEVDSSWPEFRRVATFSGSLTDSESTTLAQFFDGVSTVRLSGVGYSTSLIPGGITELLLVEISTDDGSWEVVYKSPDGWQEWEAAHYIGNGEWQQCSLTYEVS